MRGVQRLPLHTELPDAALQHLHKRFIRPVRGEAGTGGVVGQPGRRQGARAPGAEGDAGLLRPDLQESTLRAAARVRPEVQAIPGAAERGGGGGHRSAGAGLDLPSRARERGRASPGRG